MFDEDVTAALGPKRNGVVHATPPRPLARMSVEERREFGTKIAARVGCARRS
jgi:hypothetical protein